MLLRKFIISFISLSLVLAAASDTKADISNAAVLFLRIAPGSRAAAMGDAFVAIADDATATHWNPAGLGAYPIASSWQDAQLTLDDASGKQITISQFAALKSRGGKDFSAYDLWAIVGDGLGRYDNKQWHFQETFRTKTDQTLESIVASYFGIDAPDQIKSMATRVAVLNSKRTKTDVETLRDSLLAVTPETYSLRESMVAFMDSLVAAYDLAKINWEKYKEIEKTLGDGLKDGELKESELDQINFAIEKARNRFIPEEITMPYQILFSGKPTCIASTEDDLLIGTANGLVIFDGKRWRVLTTVNGLPSNNITAIYASEHEAFIGTDRGVSAFAGVEATIIADTTVLPAGVISAISGTDAGNIWAVVNSDLYHFDGSDWSNNMAYSVGIEDSPAGIAAKMAMYGSANERAAYIEKMSEVNRAFMAEAAAKSAAIAKASVIENDSTVMADSTVALDSATTADSVAVLDSTMTVAPEQPQPVVAEVEFNLEAAMQPGNSIRVPYCVAVKGAVSDMYIDRDGIVWLGTKYGIWKFDGSKWSAPGYREVAVEEGQTFDTLVEMKKHLDPVAAGKYRQLLVDLNDLSGDRVSVGQKVKVYRNPAALPVNAIDGRSGLVYFATSDGLLEFDGISWRRVDLRDLARSNVVDIQSKGDELWFASDDQIVIKANGRTEIAFMHVNWLPELANDLYYEFLSVVTNKEGLGTFGGNVTFITYGSINRTGESGQPLGTFDAFDIAFTGSFGTSLTEKLRGGISMKLIYSRLADVGAGAEKGSGTSTGFAGDIGLLYEWTPRLNLGMAITNIGPKMSYIDAAQADPLPTNLGLGFAYKVLRTDYYQFLVTGEANKMLVGLDGGFDEFKTSEGLILNGGAEFAYADLIALRAGYIFDDEGQVKTVTLGVGLRPIDKLRFDFAYIPSSDEVVLANTLRMSIAFLP